MKDKLKKFLSKLDKRVGYTLILLSIIAWIGIAVIPFSPLNTSLKLTIGTALLVLGEIFFWVGTIILGKEFVAKIKGKFKRNP